MLFPVQVEKGPRVRGEPRLRSMPTIGPGTAMPAVRAVQVASAIKRLVELLAWVEALVESSAPSRLPEPSAYEWYMRELKKTSSSLSQDELDDLVAEIAAILNDGGTHTKEFWKAFVKRHRKRTRAAAAGE